MLVLLLKTLPTPPFFPYTPHPTPYTLSFRTKAFVAFAAGPGLISNVTVPAGFYAPAYRFVNTATGQETALLTLPIVQVS